MKITSFKRSSEKAHHQQILLLELFYWRQTFHTTIHKNPGALWTHTTASGFFKNIKCKRKSFPTSVLLSLLQYENNLPAFRLWLRLLCFHFIWMQWNISVTATEIKAKRIHLLSHADARCWWHLYHHECNCTLRVNLLPPQTQTPQSHFTHFSNNGTSFLDKHITPQEQIPPDNQGQLYNAHLSGNKIH